MYKTYLSRFLKFLLELLNGPLVNTTTLVDQVPSGGRFSRVDVANNDKINVGLFLSHSIHITSIVKFGKFHSFTFILYTDNKSGF